MTQPNMRRKIHNGQVLDYSGPRFGVSRSNEITYEYFCFLGGLENERCQKMHRQNGSHYYETYHKIDSP